MRVRMLSPTGDYMFGQGQQNFWIDVPQAVGQVVETTLRLWQGEWYINTNAGTPYPEGVIGKHSQATADATIQATILGCQGVTNLQNYASTYDGTTRTYSTVSGLLQTQYGPTPLELENIGNF